MQRGPPDDKAILEKELREQWRIIKGIIKNSQPRQEDPHLEQNIQKLVDLKKRADNLNMDTSYIAADISVFWPTHKGQPNYEKVLNILVPKTNISTPKPIIPSFAFKKTLSNQDKDEDEEPKPGPKNRLH